MHAFSERAHFSGYRNDFRPQKKERPRERDLEKIVYGVSRPFLSAASLNGGIQTPPLFLFSFFSIGRDVKLPREIGIQNFDSSFVD